MASKTSNLTELREKRKEFIFISEAKFKKVSRKDIVGIESVLERVDKHISYLKNFQTFDKMGSRLEPGLLLYGSPGTGKTLTSRYIATASGARFVNVRSFPKLGNIFTSQDIRELFDISREYVKEKKEPIILFWDEFENIAEDRGELKGVAAETISQLTVELDGVLGKSPGLLLIGTTNLISRIDKALVRSGRMGEHIEFFPPDRKGKKVLLQFYVSKKPHAPKIDYKSLAFLFESENTPADIEEKVEAAYREACLRDEQTKKKLEITEEDLVKVLITYLLGAPRNIQLSRQEQLQIGIHEAGHVIVAQRCGRPVQIAGVFPSGYSGGKVVSMWEKNTASTIHFLLSGIAMGYGGHIAEEICKVAPSNTGGIEDLETATSLATHLVEGLGEGKRVGRLSIKAIAQQRAEKSPAGNVSQISQRDAELDIRDILFKQQKRAERILKNFGEENIRNFAKILVERKILTRTDIKTLLKKQR